MSNTVQIKTKMKNLECIKQAFKNLGWEIGTNQSIREHINRSDKYETVGINPRRGTYDYDVGVAREKDGSYRLDGDTWQGSIASQLGNNSGPYGRLQMEYTKECIKDQYCLEGYTVANDECVVNADNTETFVIGK